jgi:hypothetical protein
VGIVVEPPASWQPSTTLLTTLLDELAGNPVLSPVTLNQFFAQVPKGGNEEPSSRHLQGGFAPKSGVIPAATAATWPRRGPPHLVQRTRWVGISPAVFTELSDLLLATENRSFDPTERAVALAVFIQRFGTRSTWSPWPPRTPSPSPRARRIHSRVGALLRPVSGEGRPVVEQRQVHLPRRQLAHAHPRPPHHPGAH